MLRRLGSRATGLTVADAAAKLRREGPNRLSEQRRPSILSRFGRQLVHPFALLLWVGAALAVVGERVSPGEGMGLIAAALVAVALLNGSFTFWQEARAENAMAALRRMLGRRASVLREGEEFEVDVATLVRGDVLILREGDRVPADARLIEVNALRVDHASLTGESEPQLRGLAPTARRALDSRNLVFSGTLVSSGSGRALVYATGDETAIGQVARVTRETERLETPIRRELRHFIRVISSIAAALGVVFFVAGWAVGNPFWTNLVFAIGIIVANVPEGLLPTVSLALAIAGRKMASRNALIKTLESAETLGSTTVICTDKTGTLTLDEMRVSDLHLGLAELPTAPVEEVPEALLTEFEWALRVFALCNNASVTRNGDRLVFGGDPTERALLRYVEEHVPGGARALRDESPRLHELPFDSTTREMATIHETEGGRVVLLKGAPEAVIPQCATASRDGAVEAIGDELRARLLEQSAAYAARARRVLALARKEVGPEVGLEDAFQEPDYTFVGLVGLYDPPRPEVRDAVASCRRAGIAIIVVSGDHPRTVEAVAREVGIVASDAPRVYTGEVLVGLNDDQLREALDAPELLLARTSPLDKLRVVTALQVLGHVVAVTGDGVNDAPALKRADVGVAMGLTGTDVAREAAEIVLLDDNFATIVAAIEEGRVIFANIRRFVGYVLTSNVPEILPYVAYVLLGIPLPLPVLLILAIDLGTDMAPAIGLAGEPAEADVMRQPPRPRTERLLTRRLLLSSYGLGGPVEALAGFAAYAWVLQRGGWSVGEELAVTDALYGQAIAAFFGAVVLCQVANLFVWRTTHESALGRDALARRILVGVAIELALAALVVASTPGRAVFDTASPPLEVWIIPLLIASLMLGGAELWKGRRRRRLDGA